jgi:hypothetical protein
MSRDDNHNPPGDFENSEAGRKDRPKEIVREGGQQDDAASDGPSLMDTVSDPDVDTDPAEEIKEEGEPFEGNHA